jgi:hypothetical protein
VSSTALDDDPLLTIGEVARHLKTTPSGIHNRRRRGTAPPFEVIGRKLLIRQSVYLAWLDAQCARVQA